MTRYRHNVSVEAPPRESRREIRAKSGAYVKRENARHRFTRRAGRNV